MNSSTEVRPTSTGRRKAHFAVRRCACGTWFEYDALVRDDAVECPHCGRILPREHDVEEPSSLARSLVWLSTMAGVAVAGAGVLGLTKALAAGETALAVLSLLGGLFIGAIFVGGALTLRALTDAVARLEERIP